MTAGCNRATWHAISCCVWRKAFVGQGITSSHVDGVWEGNSDKESMQFSSYSIDTVLISVFIDMLHVKSMGSVLRPLSEINY